MWVKVQIGAEEIIRYPGAERTGGCETPDVGARNYAWVLCKSSKCSSLLDHFLVMKASSILLSSMILI